MASTSVCSFPVICQCPGIHCSAICLCFPLSCCIRSWQSLASVDILVSVGAADGIAAFESEKIAALLINSTYQPVRPSCSQPSPFRSSKYEFLSQSSINPS